MAQKASHRAQGAPRSTPKRAPRSQHHLLFRWFFINFSVSACSASSRPKPGPDTQISPQQAPMRAPRRPRDAPRRPKTAPTQLKLAAGGLQESCGHRTIVLTRPRRPPDGPKAFQHGPRGPQELCQKGQEAKIIDCPLLVYGFQ
eukprot:50428-Pyramimonas_sp.AAC.1